MPDDRDERLAQLLDEATRQPPDWMALRKKAPDLIEELQQLLAVGQVMSGLASVTATNDGGRETRPIPSLEGLPRSFGAYDLVQELGRGGMGIVYRAWDRALKRFVALKTILRGPHASEKDQTRFRVEAQAAGVLTHPNIVPIYQVGEQEGQAYFCMKLVEGKTLASAIAGKPLPPRQAAQILETVARAVHHAHQKGILHRDLKPSNVLLDDNGDPLVADFGLAKIVEGDASLTAAGAILGTPSYMAPEQADPHAQLAPTCDIYGIGAILYEALTGRPPFVAASPVDTLLLVRTEEPVRPKLLNPNIDTDLELICRKCLEKRPEHRYGSAEELANDLKAYLHGEPVTARTSSLVYLVTRFFRDTHHAPVLENWGLLWMWHSLQVLVLCGVTSAMYASGVHDHLPFLMLWSIGLIVWGVFFWNLRRLGGPVTFVERQIGHAWAAGVVASIGIFFIEVLLHLEVLVLSPVLAVAAGMIFLVKAGTLSGWFYIAAAACFLTAIPMAWVGPPISPLMFGAVSAVFFFIPGLKYYRQRLRQPSQP
ncbi:MAG: bifunctional serine/threonine protein kinase/MFS transporter [Gemmataceae bacterium]